MTGTVLTDATAQLRAAPRMEDVQAIVRHAAREIVAADGATFVLRESGFCFYADEDAMSPLWKGQRFPIETCISGWAMLHRTPAVIPDITVDERIPQEAYRPTFVRSLAMVPIGTSIPIGAIGAYWAAHHEATAEEIAGLEALAEATFDAIARLSAEGRGPATASERRG